MSALDWSKCRAVESVPDISAEEVIEQFDVTREQVMAVLEFMAQSLRYQQTNSRHRPHDFMPGRQRRPRAKRLLHDHVSTGHPALAL